MLRADEDLIALKIKRGSGAKAAPWLIMSSRLRRHRGPIQWPEAGDLNEVLIG